MELSEEEKKAIDWLKNTSLDPVLEYENDIKSISIVLNLIEKQQKEIEKNQKFKKDIVNLIMIWDKKALPENETIISVLDTIMSEVSRLEDIEDKKVQVAVEFVEEKRDKYWKDKIREKIKELEKCQKEELQNDDEFGTHSMKWAIADYVIETLKELLKNE